MVLSDILAPHCDTIQLPSTPLLSFLDFKHSRRLLVECYVVIISKTKSNRASFLIYIPTLFPRETAKILLLLTQLEGRSRAQWIRI